MSRVSRGIGWGLVAALILTAGCSVKEENMQTVAQADATRRVGQDAEVVRAAAGAGDFSQANANVSPCDGKRGELSDTGEVYYIQGIYQLLIPAEQHRAVLEKAKAALLGSGYTVTKERDYDAGGGEVFAKTEDGHDLILASGEGRAMSLLLSSPCYRTPAP